MLRRRKRQWIADGCRGRVGLSSGRDFSPLAKRRSDGRWSSPDDSQKRPAGKDRGWTLEKCGWTREPKWKRLCAGEPGCRLLAWQRNRRISRTRRGRTLVRRSVRSYQHCGLCRQIFTGLRCRCSGSWSNVESLEV